MQTLEPNDVGRKLHISVIFNTLRILKKVNPGDSYYENYFWHFNRDGLKFYDLYMLLWELGSSYPPKRILEIGTRTGISLCQLLSAYLDHTIIERIICVDPFNDGFISPNLVKKNLKHLHIPIDKLTFIEESSESAMPKLIQDGKTFDYILVDGDHAKSAALRDLENAHQLIEKEGIIVFDDISPYGCDLIDVWNQFKANHKSEYDFEERMEGKGVAWASRL